MRHAIPAVGPQWVEAAGDLTWPLAELRRGRAVRAPASNRPPSVRAGDNPHRTGQQLRPAAGLGGGELRTDAGDGPTRPPRRARHLDQGRLRHVARAIWRMGLAQVSPGEPGSEPETDGPGLRRYLLLAPLRSGHPARGDDGRARLSGAAGQGAIRGHLVLFGAAHARGASDPPPAGDAAA